VPSSREGCPQKDTSQYGGEMAPTPRYDDLDRAPARLPLFDASNAAFDLHSQTLRCPFVG
jgi:hypothetical protein